MQRDAAALVREGLRTHRLRIADAQQRGVALGEHRGHVGLLREIGRLARIGLEIVQLGPESDVVDVFPAAVADHEGAGDRCGGVILRQHVAIGPRARRAISHSECEGSARSSCGSGQPTASSTVR